jgi:hypothetical protein
MISSVPIQLVQVSKLITQPFAETDRSAQNTRPNMALSPPPNTTLLPQNTALTNEAIIAIVGIVCSLPPAILTVWQLCRRREREYEEGAAGM